MNDMGVIERKVIGAMLIMTDENNIAKVTLQDVADLIGYKKSGGALSFAIKILERDNYLVKIASQTYKILI